MVARLLVLFALVSLANCTGGGGYSAGPNPPAPISHPESSPHANPYAGPQHAYVDDGFGHVLIYTLPLTPASVPIGKFYVNGGAHPGCSDNQGRLLVLDGAFIHVFTQPISPQSTEAFRLRSPSQSNFRCAVDPAGNLYVPEYSQYGSYMDVYAAPVEAGSRPVAEIFVENLPRGVTTDNVGDVFETTEFLFGSTSIQEFSPRSSGNKLVATFGIDDQFGGSVGAVGPDGKLYVASIGIDVYLPAAFHNGGVKDHSIAVKGANGVISIAFGLNGDMIVTGSVGRYPRVQMRLYVLHPPYAAPAFSIPTPGLALFGGIAITQ